MKKVFMVILALTLVMASAGCGSDEKGSSLKESDKNSADYQIEHFAEDADKNADSSKIDGVTATQSENKDEENVKPSKKIVVDEKYEVSIDNVVVTQHEERNVAIVDFTFKNKSADDVMFTSVIDAVAYQNGEELTPAVFQNALDGFEPNTIAQSVGKGESITVQKAYALKDTAAPVEISISSFLNSSMELGGATFEIAQ